MRPLFFSAPLPLSDGSLTHRVLMEVDGEHSVVWTAVNAEQLAAELNRAVSSVLGPG
jgi:hypothetical protein